MILCHKYHLCVTLLLLTVAVKRTSNIFAMNHTSKIYVAGHTGLVGSALVRILQTQGYTNIVTRSHVELDLCRQQHVEDFFEHERPEFVFLAAARVGGILANSTYPVDFLYDNTM